MNKPADSLKLNHLYVISFIEGGVVMVTEIAGARLLTPYFGASLYSWAATLSVTLFALMSGYYSGGYVTTKPKFSSGSQIIRIFIFSGLAVILMPSLGHFIMQRTIHLSFFTGLLISEFLFLFLPIFLMGMISPMIIFNITKKAELSGRFTGNIYAISTSGGILFTLSFGFLVIPYYGISDPLRILGLCVALLGLSFLLKDKLTLKKAPAPIVLTLLVSFFAFHHSTSRNLEVNTSMHLLETSEGLLGELKVIDQLSTPPNASPVRIRKLRINNISQNYVFADLPTQSLMYYVNLIKQLLHFLPQPKNSALLIGLGAGSLYKILSDQYKEVETIELDKRIYDMGIKYFGMPDHKNHFITDGRYFINTTKKKYDLVVLDAIVGENVPAQLTTLESFQRMYEILNENGTLIIENGGLDSFSDNSFVPSLAKTLQAAGFQITVLNPLLSDTYGDALFIATKSKFETQGLLLTDDVLVERGPLDHYLLPLSLFDTGHAMVLTDDKNRSDILLRAHYFHIRETVRKELVKYNFWEQ